jgi:hypothetical protein
MICHSTSEWKGKKVTVKPSGESFTHFTHPLSGRHLNLTFPLTGILCWRRRHDGYPRPSSEPPFGQGGAQQHLYGAFARVSLLPTSSQLIVCVVRHVSYGRIVVLTLSSSRERCKVLLPWIPLPTTVVSFLFHYIAAL